MDRVGAADSPEVLERFHGQLGLVDILAKQMMRSLRWPVDLEDLVSAGREGLWEAARRYDPESAVPFKAYAGYRVRGAMVDHVRRMAAVPRRAYERLVAVEAAHLASEALAERSLSEPTAHLPEAATEEAIDEHLAVLLLAQAVRLAGQACHQEPEEAPADPEQAYLAAELEATIHAEVQCLRPAQAEVIRRHYFKHQDFGQIAAELNMSKAWVSRTHARALTRLFVRLRVVEEPIDD